MPSKNKKNFLTFFVDLKVNAQKHTSNLLLISFFSAIFGVIILAGFISLYYLTVLLNNAAFFPALRFTFLVINYALVLVLAAIIQILTIKTFYEPRFNFASLADIVKKYFWKFLGLSIVINIFFFLFSMPIYAAIFLFLIQSYVLGIIALIFGILLLLLFCSYVLASPFILIEKQEKIYPALKQSMDLAANDIWGIFSKLIVLIIFVVLLNFFFALFINIPYLGGLVELAGLFFFYILFFLYFYTLYEDLKSRA